MRLRVQSSEFKPEPCKTVSQLTVVHYALGSVSGALETWVEALERWLRG